MSKINNIHSASNIKIALSLLERISSAWSIVTGSPEAEECKTKSIDISVKNNLIEAPAFCDVIDHPRGSHFPRIKDRDVSVDIEGYETYVDSIPSEVDYDTAGNFERALMDGKFYKIAITASIVNPASGAVTNNVSIFTYDTFITKGKFTAGGDAIMGNMSFEGVGT